MANETELLDQGTRLAGEAGRRVLNEGGGLLSSIWSGLTSPISSGISGVLHWGPMIAIGTFVSGLIAPDLWLGASELATRAFGPNNMISNAARRVGEGGVPQLALMSAAAGALGGGAVGAGSGALSGATGGVGSLLGTLAFGAVGAVAIGALNQNGVTADRTASNDVRPPAVPTGSSAPTRQPGA